jgi:hypothetical protein
VQNDTFVKFTDRNLLAGSLGGKAPRAADRTPVHELGDGKPHSIRSHARMAWALMNFAIMYGKAMRRSAMLAVIHISAPYYFPAHIL